MARPLLVVISGPPGAGKTAIAERLADALHLPRLNKDGFKETLFDSLGWSDLEWSGRVGAASMALLFHTAGRLLAAGTSVVVEANFSTDLSCAEFRALQTRHGAAACQVLCWASSGVLVDRFRERVASGHRHPGHVDHLTSQRIQSLVADGRAQHLCLDGPIFELDTTDFSSIDFGALVAAIERQFGAGPTDGAQPPRDGAEAPQPASASPSPDPKTFVEEHEIEYNFD